MGCLLVLTLASSKLLAQPKAFVQHRSKMGSAFSLTLYGTDEASLQPHFARAWAEIDRIERLISSWQANSQTSKINQQAGQKAVPVSKELYDLIYRALKVSRLTKGAFDISYAAMDRIWKFDGSMTELPPPEKIQASIRHVGYAQVELRPSDTTVFLKQSGMKIGFGAIGKGYAANRVRDLLKKAGLAQGLINAGGDLFCWGKPPGKKYWEIGLAHPAKPGQWIAWIPLRDQSVVTSGDYERFVEFEGKQYAHIIDPRTGWPASGLKSVSVICPDAELADALATAVFVMGAQKGLALVNQLKGIECILVNDQDQMLQSKGLVLPDFDARPLDGAIFPEKKP